MGSPCSHLAARHFLNDLIGVRAFERGEPIARHRPVEVHVQITSGCNLDCVMCLEHLRPVKERHGRHMKLASPELFARIEREIFPHSSRVHLGVGAEPMLSPHFLDFLVRSRAADQEVQLTTNGTRIGSEHTARILVETCRSIEVSVDGATADTYETIRRGGSFARVSIGLQRLSFARRAMSANERPRFTLCMVLMQCNVHELPTYVEWARELDADVAAWHVIPVTPEGAAQSLCDEDALAQEWIERGRERALQLGVRADLPGRPASPSPPPAPTDDLGVPRAMAIRRLRDLEEAQGHEQANAITRCHVPTLGIYVLYDGRVYPCGNPHAHLQAPIGNLLEENFETIWNGRAYRNLRAGLARGDAPPLCRTCPLTHDPAPALQDSNGNGAGPEFLSYYGERDLAPHRETEPSGRLVDLMVETEVAEHLTRLVDELGQTKRHAAYVEDVLDQTSRHLASLEDELGQTREHAATLKGELWHVRGHAANLQRILDRIQGERVYDALCWVKDRLIGKG